MNQLLGQATDIYMYLRRPATKEQPLTKRDRKLLDAVTEMLIAEAKLATQQALLDYSSKND